MDYFVKIIQALAWPLTVLVLTLLYMRELKAVLTRLSHLKIPGVEADFGENLEEAEEIARAVELPPKKKAEKVDFSTIDAEERLNRLIEVSPRAAITEAWIEVETAVDVAAELQGIQRNTHMPKRGLVQKLVRMDILDHQALETFDRLRELRNEAAHARDFTIPESETERYVYLAKVLATYIRLQSQPHLKRKRNP